MAKYIKKVEDILNQVRSLDKSIAELQLSTEEIKTDTRRILETLENI
jgi:prefoldin subunit 5